MAIQLSTTVQDEAREMAAKGHLWGRGVSKVNGREFYIIPSRTEPGIAHWTTDYGCTCRGARRYGDCAHQEAVRIFEARGTVPTFKDYAALFPGCIDGCGDLTEKPMTRCYACESKNVYRQEQERKRENQDAVRRANVLLFGSEA